MLRSLAAGVSGLKSHQTVLDVVANNIANVNTAGYKASRATFATSIAQTIRGATQFDQNLGGTNPMQVGLGSSIGSIDRIDTQGGLNFTGRSTDVAIEGAGFFTVRSGSETFYTRSGAFSVDAGGSLVTPSGARVRGWVADANGVANVNGVTGDLSIPLNLVSNPSATTQTTVGGILPAGVSPSDPLVDRTVTTSIDVFDSLGKSHQLEISFVKQTNTDWDISVGYYDAAGTLVDITPPGPPQATFDATGELTSAPVVSLAGVTFPGGPAPQNIDVVLSGPTARLTHFDAQASARFRDQNGYTSGQLNLFTIGSTGAIDGRFSNGQTRLLGMIALATFAQPNGLTAVGNSMLQESSASGLATLSTGGSNGAGSMLASTLESSNVDLANEFTQLIMAQRGFQANSRTITTSDEVLTELVNLKR
jgi:flagellar hook protein FlgE